MQSTVAITVVMPCLNEADTLAACIGKAWRGIENSGLAGEVVIADNGSTDGSLEIAAKLGARVVPVTERGYGSALAGGIAAARGEFIVMGDADDSYDFLEIPAFVRELQKGNDLVMGCRLPAGGGRIEAGAMPFSHRWIGNPMFSFMVRHMFQAPIHDVYCGLRGFRKEAWRRLDLRCCGMEFATEMIIKASLLKLRISEIPVTLHPDGRKAHAPHLRTVRDGWRTLRFFLIFSPRWLFLYPGVILVLLGIAGYCISMPGLQVGRVTFDTQTLLFASLAMIIGYQSMVFAIFAKTFAIRENLLPNDERMQRFFAVIYLERGLLAGFGALVLGGVLLGLVVVQWWSVHFGDLNHADTMRKVIPGVTLAALGYQTILSSFLLSMLGIPRRAAVA